VPAAGGGEAVARHVAARREQAEAARAALAAAAEVALDGPAAVPPPPIVTERPLAEGETRVPDVTGRTARASLVALRGAGLAGSLEGSGVVAHQEPAPGTVLARGGRVRVLLAAPDITDDSEDVPVQDVVAVAPIGVHGAGLAAPEVAQ
jgi:cell division protein FtsI (penicillin-binding protein 3)